MKYLLFIICICLIGSYFTYDNAKKDIAYQAKCEDIGAQAIRNVEGSFFCVKEYK